ncbi:hypothetical protein CMV_006402 [Castanea mollissima]|uniref:Uncharacterized protein n=1 Tax=Castanea mollissima TaxID=60419 RepID=A0A8J4RPH0_9ROSI|nr:hypothetical protein CMV_006402 [Castanea mollissima]
MASQTDLIKIGMEGFALSDEFHGRSRRPSVHHRSQVPKKQPEMTIVCKMPAPEINGGTLITDFTNEKVIRFISGLN